MIGDDDCVTTLCAHSNVADVMTSGDPPIFETLIVVFEGPVDVADSETPVDGSIDDWEGVVHTADNDNEP